MNGFNNHPTSDDDSLKWLSISARRGDDDTAREREAARLEGQLQPIVRLALRKGVGIPRVVGWVREAHARLSNGARTTPPEQYAVEITRMLTATLLDKSSRHASVHDTVMGI
jgi:hypothetical protein